MHEIAVLVLFGTSGNSRTHSKVNDKTQCSCFLVLCGIAKQMQLRKSTKEYEKHAQGGIVEAYRKHCDTVLIPNFPKKQFRCFLVLFRAFWNRRANNKMQDRPVFMLFGALCYRRNHCNHVKLLNSMKSTKSTRGDWGGVHKTL